MQFLPPLPSLLLIVSYSKAETPSQGVIGEIRAQTIRGEKQYNKERANERRTAGMRSRDEENKGKREWSLRIFPVEGIFPLELTWVLTTFPQNSFGWEYKPRSSLCTHAFHRMDSKDPDVHVLDGWIPATKTHPACTIHEDGMWLPQWLHKSKDKTKQRKGHIGKNLTQNGEPQRCSWKMQKKPIK